MAATLRVTGSLTIRAPGGMMTDACPPKVSGVPVPVIPLAPELSSVRSAPRPMVSGSRPNSLVRMTRTEPPPSEMWTISRRVVPVVPSAPNFAVGIAGCNGRGRPGSHPVVGGVAAVAGIVVKQWRKKNARVGRRDRSRCLVMTVLNAIWVTAPCYRCFAAAGSITYSGEGCWSELGYLAAKRTAWQCARRLK